MNARFAAIEPHPEIKPGYARRIWLYFVLLSLLMTVTALAIYWQQHATARAEAQRHAEEQLDFFALVLGQRLSVGRFEGIDQLLEEWGEIDPQTVEFELKADNGYVLAHYRRVKVVANPLEVHVQLAFGYRGQATLRLVYDQAWHYQRLERLALGLGAAALLAMLAFGLLGWLLWRWQREAEAVSRHRDELHTLNRHLSLTDFALNRMQEGAFLVDEQARFHWVNQVAAEALGYSETELLAMGIKDLTPEWRPELWSRHWQAVADRGAVTVRETHVTREGREIPVEINSSHIEFEQHSYILALVRDISERQRAEERLRLAAAVFENTDEGVVITNANAKIIEVNRAFTDILGYGRDEVIGQTPQVWRSDRHDEMFYRGMWQALRSAGRWRGEIWNRRKNGEIFPEWQTISSVCDQAGHITHYIGVFTDISQIKHSQEQLDHLAHHDPLTDLPNRLLLDERLEQTIVRAERNQQTFALVFMDLDRFKHINDSLGHTVGDQLLRVAAERLRNTLRRGDTIARLGGDEFVLILEDVARAEDAGVAAEKLLLAIGEPFRLGQHSISTSASLGIALFPRDGTDTDTLMRNADAAMYLAKEDGRGTYRFYTKELTQAAFERVSLENSLRQALENDELTLHYQPQADLRTGALVGVEVLLRWRHPERGMLPPAQYIDIAEEVGLIHDLGRWVLHVACRQARDWLDRGLDFGYVAVNVSGPQLQRGGLVEQVEEALRISGLPARYLELEITESFIMKEADSTIRQLEQIRALGVTLAVDDFGTGHSSLSYLKQLPVHRLKLDQSFVRDIPEDPNDMAIANAVIAMGKIMGLVVIAEGVETPEQADFLLEAGCELAQGFLYGRPVPAVVLAESLQAKSARQAIDGTAVWVRNRTAADAEDRH